MIAVLAAFVLAAAFGVAAAADTPDGGSLPAVVARASAPPKEPQPCHGPTSSKPVRDQGTIGYEDFLCGSRGPDWFKTVGGGDHVWTYQGNDTIVSRDRKPDEVWGGPGRDTADTDWCDTVHGVENRKISTADCPGVKSQGWSQATDELPAFDPVVECWTATDGSRRILYLWEPEVRALDVTTNVDFQTVAWQGVVLKKVGDEWQVFIDGSWFWDRTYDLQVEAFPGNYWRSFETGQRTFVSYRLDSPGVYAVGVRLHWYKTASAPERDGIAVARAHYGPNEQPGHAACEFPV
jgi:hypothetical protein